MTTRWRSLIGRLAISSQRRAFSSTAMRVVSEPSMARPKQDTKQPIHSETSGVPF